MIVAPIPVEPVDGESEDLAVVVALVVVVALAVVVVVLAVVVVLPTVVVVAGVGA